MTKDKGFTLIEILVGLAITVILSAVGILNLSSFRASRSLRANMEEAESAVLDARDRSRTQEDGYSWGMRFSNADGAGRYELVSGTSYLPANVLRSYRLSSGVRFSAPYEGSGFDVFFESVSGGLTAARIISLTHPGSASLVGDITLSTLGTVGTRIRRAIFGYWHFDESAGAILFDASPSGNGAMLQAGASRSSLCKAGGCASFDGVDDYAFGNFSRTFSGFTISGWAHLTDFGNSGSLFSGYSGSTGVLYARFLVSSRKPSFFTFPSGGSAEELTSATQVSLNEWHHLAYVYDGAMKRIYLDGEEVGAAPLSNAVFSFNNFEIGRSEKMPEKVFEGLLDEIRFYGRALSPEEVREEYNELQ